MILGIGSDLVKVSRMQTNIERYGERFMQRLLSDEELAQWQDRVEQLNNNLTSHCANFLAKRWAAKEAFVKALGTGFRNGISWREISLMHTSLGQPCLMLHRQTESTLQDRNIAQIHVSLSDEDGYVLAMVVLEGESG